jgi:hypothetical protein
LDKWVLLHVRKKLVNPSVRILNRLISARDPQYPQTQLLEDVYRKLFQAYKLEAFCGRFDDLPYQDLSALRDKHFLNILELSRKLLIYLGDTDRYYRQWLGLFFLLIHDFVEEHQQSMLFEEFLTSARAQWEFDMRGAFPKEHFNENKRIFQEIMLANFLFNLCSKEYEGYPSSPRYAKKLERGEK